MMKEHKLEEISWKDGKHVNGEGNPVFPRQIGNSIILKSIGPHHINVRDELRDNLPKLIGKDMSYQEANAFSRGEEKRIGSGYSERFVTSVVLYKI